MISKIRKQMKDDNYQTSCHYGKPFCIDCGLSVLNNQMNTLTAQLKIAREKFQQIMEVSGTSTLHYKLAEEGLEELNDRN